MIGDFVCSCLGFGVVFVISCLETVPQHMLGQPLFNTSMEASDMTVKYTHKMPYKQHSNKVQ